MKSSLPSPDFQEKIQIICTVPEPEAQFKKELRLKIQEKAKRKSPKPKTLPLPRLVWIILITIVLITATATFFIGPQKVWAAVQGWVRYIPGIGFIQENNTIRSLPNPLQQTQDGVTVTIQDIIVTESSTFINLPIKGVLSDQVIEAGTPNQSSQLELTLPDLTRISLKGYNISFMEKEPTIQLVFEAIPTSITQFNLSFESIPGIPASLAPSGWSFPIKLSVETSANHTIPARFLTLSSKPDQELVLKVNSMAYLHNSTAIEIQMVSNDPNMNVSLNWWNSVVVYDENDRYYPFEGIPIQSLDNRDTIIVFTKPLDPGLNYTISIPNGFQLIHQLPQDKQYNFELVPEAASGQSWELNRQFNLNNHSVSLTGARLLRVEDDRVLLKFQFEAEPALTNLAVTPMNEEPNVIRIFPDGIEFKEFPTHPVQFRISNYQTFVKGNWQVIIPALP